MSSHEHLSDDELNHLCCERLGWELRPHLWEYGSEWRETAWFKGETLLGFPNFLIHDPVIEYLQEHLVERGLEDPFGVCLFNLLGAHDLHHSRAWFTLAHAPLKLRVLAFLEVTRT